MAHERPVDYIDPHALLDPPWQVIFLPWLEDYLVELAGSGQSWKELLVDLKARGLTIAPDIAVGDGALGFWKALDEVFPSTRHQRCWQHKTLNVLDKLPKSVQPNAHQDLREIWLSENRATAEAGMIIFAKKYAPKYDCDCMDAA